MIRGKEEFELLQDVAAAQREAAASEAVTARARARRSPFARQRRANRRVRILGACTVVAAVVAWASFRNEGPSEVELRHGAEVALMLAAEWTRDYVRANGRLPVRLADDLPLAADVQMQPDRSGVRLSVRDTEGVEHALFVFVGTVP